MPEARLEPEEAAPTAPDGRDRVARSRVAAFAFLLLAAFGLSFLQGPAAAAPATTNFQPFITAPLTLGDAVNLALQQNPALLKARKDLEATHGVAIQTRAILIPKVGLTGNYGFVQQIDIDTFRAPGGITFGNNAELGDPTSCGPINL